jgi:hypothetical protein
MSERDALLFANEAFYQAFNDRDLKAMDATWSRGAPCVCIHPGWGALSGRDDVMRSWAAIIANPDSPRIRCHNATGYIYGSVGFVVCFEELDGQFLIATNVFVHEGSLWKMVHHQAGPTSEAPRPEPSEGKGAVN